MHLLPETEINKNQMKILYKRKRWDVLIEKDKVRVGRFDYNFDNPRIFKSKIDMAKSAIDEHINRVEKLYKTRYGQYLLRNKTRCKNWRERNKDKVKAYLQKHKSHYRKYKREYMKAYRLKLKREAGYV